jgi:hypothetical protein
VSTPGSIEDEATRLVGAVHDWIARTFPAPEDPAGRSGEQAHAGHIATGAPECAWCPVCRLIGVVRGDHPEVTERLVDAGTAVLAALRALLDATAGTGHPTGQPTGQPTEQPTEPERRTGVQKIDLDGGAV